MLWLWEEDGGDDEYGGSIGMLNGSGKGRGQRRRAEADFQNPYK